MVYPVDGPFISSTSWQFQLRQLKILLD